MEPDETDRFDEDDFLAILRARTSRSPGSSAITTGIGDDAAILSLSADAVVTTDLLIEGIDFEVKSCGYARAGRKAIAKNLSDLAAMGALPVAAFLSIALPRGISRRDARALVDGICDEADRFDCPIAGGDTKRSPTGLIVNVLLIGRPSGGQNLLRSGARVGDVLIVTGELGGAELGKHLDFEPRLQAGAALVRLGAHAAIDLSDGLARDLRLLCDASGCGARIDVAKLPISTAARRLASPRGRSALEHALHDGEDYELLAALPRRALASIKDEPALEGAVEIGEIVSADRGIELQDGETTRRLERGGFRHRFDETPE